MPTVVSEYFIPKNKTSDYLILIVALFLIIGVWTIILIFTIKKDTTLNSDYKAFEICPAGECPTDRFTGQKRCPVNLALPMQYDPITEVCNPANACTSQSTPYAVLSNGATDLSGQCGAGNNNCRCVNFFQTPSYTQVIFNMVNGNFYSQFSEEQQRVNFVQQPSPYVGEGNNVPTLYKDPSTQFYEISPSILYYLSPNPCSNIYADKPEISNEQLLQCINLNPCISGRLAYVPQNSTAYIGFSDNDISGGVPLSCVPNSVENSPNGDNSCQTTSPGSLYAPVFNLNNGRIFCKQTGFNN
jgi:hypothetical protein